MVFMCHHLSVKTWLCCYFSAETWRRLRIVQSRWRRSASRQGIERILVKTKMDLKRQGAEACKRCQTLVELLYLQVSTTQFLSPDAIMYPARSVNQTSVFRLRPWWAAVPGEVFSLVLAPISAGPWSKRRTLKNTEQYVVCAKWFGLGRLSAPFFPQEFQQTLFEERIQTQLSSEDCWGFETAQGLWCDTFQSISHILKSNEFIWFEGGINEYRTL